MKHIYVNGTILTMEDVQKQVEAICFENERIVGLGNRSDLIKRFPEAEIHDLCGKTMLPAFLDAHSHFTGVANALTDMCLMKLAWSNRFTFLMLLHIWELPIALLCRHVVYTMQ